MRAIAFDDEDAARPDTPETGAEGSGRPQAPPLPGDARIGTS